MVMTRAAPPAKEKYEVGVRLCFSQIAVKPGPFAQAKSCNYLPNVMMKKESVDRGFDFAINKNSDGKIAEGPTENILVWTKSGDLIAPKFDYTLRGTTLVRVLELAREARDLLNIGAVDVGDLRDDDLFDAREVMMVGTTLEVMPATQIENRKIADGRVGPLARQLRALLLRDISAE